MHKNQNNRKIKQKGKETQRKQTKKLILNK